MTARDQAFDSDDAFDRRLSTLVVATADDSDANIARVVHEVLSLVREHLGMDVAFVSQFVQGQRVFRAVDQSAARPVLSVGHSDPLEQSFCQRIIDGRLPQLVADVAALPNAGDLPRVDFPIGAHLSTPVVLRDGAVYGTLCCFSFAPNDALTQRDLKRLVMAAELAARLVDQANERAEREAP